MTRVEQVEKTISKLSADQLRRFRAWFERFDAQAWDEQFTQDAESGRLDAAAEKALADLQSGKCTPL